MTVFKAYLKILAKNKMTIILYTIILLSFGTLSLEANQSQTSFEASKPRVLIVNQDEKVGVTKSLINYITKNSKIIKISNDEDKINDALFYEDVNYVIYIPKNYHKDFMAGKSPRLNVKRGTSASADFAEMLLKRYISTASIYQQNISDENLLVEKVDDTLSKKVKVQVNSKIDINSLNKMKRYYNFASYSFLACLLFVICIILASFRQDIVNKRITVSSMNYKKHNRILFFSNLLYSFIIWLFYICISLFLIGKEMFTVYGSIYIINSLLFVAMATSLAFFIGSIVKSKNAINGIVNVIALGSSFLCGAFVPMELLPKGVLKMAHVFPTYYYIKSNELLSTIENINFVNLRPIFINMLAIVLFLLLFITLTNTFTKKSKSINY